MVFTGRHMHVMMGESLTGMTVHLREARARWRASRKGHTLCLWFAWRIVCFLISCCNTFDISYLLSLCVILPRCSVP